MFFSTKINPGWTSTHSQNGPLVYSDERKFGGLREKLKDIFWALVKLGRRKKLHYSYNFILSAEIYFLYFDTVYVVKIGILKSQIKVIYSD